MTKPRFRRYGVKKPDKHRVQLWLLDEERKRLGVLCAELGITVQTFFRRLLRGALGGVESGDREDPF